MCCEFILGCSLFTSDKLSVKFKKVIAGVLIESFLRLLFDIPILVITLLFEDGTIKKDDYAEVPLLDSSGKAQHASPDPLVFGIVNMFVKHSKGLVGFSIASIAVTTVWSISSLPASKFKNNVLYLIPWLLISLCVLAFDIAAIIYWALAASEDFSEFTNTYGNKVQNPPLLNFGLSLIPLYFSRGFWMIFNICIVVFLFVRIFKEFSGSETEPQQNRHVTTEGPGYDAYGYGQSPQKIYASDAYSHHLPQYEYTKPITERPPQNGNEQNIAALIPRVTTISPTSYLPPKEEGNDSSNPSSPVSDSDNSGMFPAEVEATEDPYHFSTGSGQYVYLPRVELPKIELRKTENGDLMFQEFNAANQNLPNSNTEEQPDYSPSYPRDHSQNSVSFAPEHDVEPELDYKDDVEPMPDYERNRY